MSSSIKVRQDRGRRPGSPEAVATGCTCPIMDNAYGAGQLGLGRHWWRDEACPLHGVEIKPATDRLILQPEGARVSDG